MGSRMFWIAIMAALVIVPGMAGAEGSSVEDMSEERSVVFLNQNPTQEEDVSLGEEVLGFFEKPVSFAGRDHELNRQLAFQLQSDQGSDVSSVAASGAKKINPGRAILMSALIPGAGQFYAASNMESNTVAYIKSAVFFAAELGFWTGAILYAKKGQDKEDEFELYADKNWNEDVYRSWEYWLATTKGGQLSDSLYPYSQDQWENESWDTRLQFLPANFTHQLPDSKDQQYYEMIGKYLTQFGAAWDDVYPDNPSEWSGFFSTFYDDKTYLNLHSVLANTYAQMRYDSNKLLDKSAAFFMAIMVNHVVSAVDAGFTVRLHNKRIMSGEVTSKTTFFNGEPVVMGGVNLTF